MLYESPSWHDKQLPTHPVAGSVGQNDALVTARVRSFVEGLNKKLEMLAGNSIVLNDESVLSCIRKSFKKRNASNRAYKACVRSLPRVSGCSFAAVRYVLGPRGVGTVSSHIGTPRH